MNTKKSGQYELDASIQLTSAINSTTLISAEVVVVLAVGFLTGHRLVMYVSILSRRVIGGMEFNVV